MVPLLDARVVLYQHFLELDRRVKRAASHDVVCMRMMTVPGVGPFASLTFKAAVAVARKLAVLLHRMWVDGTEFRQDQVGGVAGSKTPTTQS